MRRHLTGYGSAHQCDVMHAAEALARDYWHDKFHEADAANERMKILEHEQRRASEPLYRIGPKEPPKLIDEGIWSSENTRDKQSLDWAEDRLNALGFTATKDRNVRSYTLEMDGVLICADPRQFGRIVFSVYPQAPGGTKKTRGRGPRFTPTFYMLDGWKHDLPGKFIARAKDAIGGLQG